MDKQKNNKKIWWIIVVVIVVLTLAIVLVFATRQTAVAPEDGEEINQSDEIDNSNWKTYQNEEYGFSFKYPGEWEIYKSDNKEIIFIDISKEEMENLENQFQESLQKLGATDSLPEYEYNKLILKINKNSSSDLDEWLRKEYLLTDNMYSIEKININNVSGYYVENREWVTHQIFSIKIKSGEIITLDKYLKVQNDSKKIKIFKKIIQTVNN